MCTTGRRPSCSPLRPQGPRGPEAAYGGEVLDWSDAIERAARELGVADVEGVTAHVLARRERGARLEHVGELALAWAAGRGNGKATRRIDELVRREAVAAARRVDGAAAFGDEVVQATRIRLLVGERPRVEEYGGRGPLGAWIGVAALRVALNAMRGARASAGEVLGELIGAEQDPELRHLKGLYRAEFKEALEAALAALPERQRAVLRMAFVDGLSMTALGRLYEVHETTAARWVRAAAAAVAEDARRRLEERLRVSEASLASLERMVLSGLELSIARVLR